MAKGEKITITRHGIPAAVLVPVGETEEKLSHKDIVEGMRALRKRVEPDVMSVKEMIDEGRGFGAGSWSTLQLSSHGPSQIKPMTMLMGCSSLLTAGRCWCRPSGALKSPTRFWLAKGRKRLNQPQIKQFTILLENLSLVHDSRPVANAVNDVLPLARTYGLTAYDAAYLELSIRSGTPLETLDDKLRKARSERGLRCSLEAANKAA